MGLWCTLDFMDSERRTRRSENSFRALCFQLDRVRRHEDVEAIALADVDGLLLAHAGPEPVCEELAAYAPFSQDPSFQISWPGALQDRTVVFEPLVMDGQPLYLVCAGRPRSGREPLNHSVQGVFRILGAPLARNLD